MKQGQFFQLTCIKLEHFMMKLTRTIKASSQKTLIKEKEIEEHVPSLKEAIFR